MQTSYEVYFAPFKPFVWLMLVLAACVSSVADTFLLRGFAGHATSTSIASNIYGLLFWKFCSLYGQYTDSSRPMLAQVCPRQLLSQGILIVSTTFWLLGNTLIINSYGAAFNAETLFPFPYVTSYKSVLELENFTLYFLLSGHECSTFLQGKAAKATLERACHHGGSHIFPECELVSQIHRDWFFYAVQVSQIGWAFKRGRGNAKKLAHVTKQKELLHGFLRNGFPLCSSLRGMELVIERALKRGTKIAFVIYTYEFQHNWEKFRELMKRHPSWKIANNFGSEDKFGVHQKAYVFSGGLRRRYRERFEGRLWTLLSSGIYSLWIKWQRIRFSSSGLRNDEMGLHSFNGSPGEPVSFKNSAFSWLLWAQLLAWLAALLVLCLERFSIFLPHLVNYCVHSWHIYLAKYGLRNCRLPNFGGRG